MERERGMTWVPVENGSNEGSPVGNLGIKTETVNTATTLRKFYKVTRTGMAAYDSLGY